MADQNNSTQTEKSSPKVLVLTDELIEHARGAMVRIDEMILRLDTIDHLVNMSISMATNKEQAALLKGASAVLTRAREQACAGVFDLEEPCLNMAIASVSHAINAAVASRVATPES